MQETMTRIENALRELGIKSPNEGYDLNDLACDLVLELSAHKVVILNKETYDDMVKANRDTLDGVDHG